MQKKLRRFMLCAAACLMLPAMGCGAGTGAANTETGAAGADAVNAETDTASAAGTEVPTGAAAETAAGASPGTASAETGTAGANAVDAETDTAIAGEEAPTNAAAETAAAGESAVRPDTTLPEVAALEPVYDYTIEELNAESDGHTVKGSLYLPKDAQTPVPAVIFSHGFGGSYEEFLAACETLAGQGIAAASIGFYGGSPTSISGGNMEEMTVFTEQADLEAIIDTLTAREDIQKDALYLFGHSQGGFVSTLAAADRPDDIAGLFLFAPAFHIPDSMRESYPSYDAIESSQTGPLVIGKAYAQVVYDYDIFETMAKYPGPVYIYHGTADPAVNISYSKKALKYFPNAALEPLQGTGHVIPEDIMTQICAKIADLLTK